VPDVTLLGGGAAHADLRLIEPFGDFRLRLRIRLRGGLDLNFSDKWSARVQLRSGAQDSQQSPHISCC
jgi:hypothetical protein